MCYTAGHDGIDRPNARGTGAELVLSRAAVVSRPLGHWQKPGVENQESTLRPVTRHVHMRMHRKRGCVGGMAFSTRFRVTLAIDSVAGSRGIPCPSCLGPPYYQCQPYAGGRQWKHWRSFGSEIMPRRPGWSAQGERAVAPACALTPPLSGEDRRAAFDRLGLHSL